MTEEEVLDVLADMLDVLEASGEQITTKEATEKLAVMWTIVHTIADPDNAGFYDDDDGHLHIECDWCDGKETGSGRELSFIHTPGCIVTKARILLGYAHPEHMHPSDKALDLNMHYDGRKKENQHD